MSGPRLLRYRLECQTRLGGNGSAGGGNPLSLQPFPFRSQACRRSLPMNVTHALAPHLPYLRRYARALTGSQESGDAYVRAALTALLAGEHVLNESLPP